MLKISDECDAIIATAMEDSLPSMAHAISYKPKINDMHKSLDATIHISSG